MYPLTHAYAVGRLVRPAGRLHVLGAIFPDTVLINGLAWEQTHHAGADLYAFLAARCPTGLPFAVGVISHGCTPPGLDYYGDRKYAAFERGYAFEEARPYAARVAEICHLPASMGWWKAHNFVEMAIEWLLARQHPHLRRRVQQALADPVGLDSPGAELVGSLPAMAPFLTLETVTPATLAERYQRQVRHRHGVCAIEVARAAALIEEIAGAIQPRCWAFLEDALGRIAATLEREAWMG